jgi:hypothetical protein
VSRSRFDGPGLALAYAILWGGAVTVLESMSWAFYAPADADAAVVLAVLLLMWTSRALVLTLSAHAAAGRLRAGGLVALFAAEVLLLALAWDGSVPVAQAVQHIGLPVMPRDNFIFNLWVLVIYGGPLFWLCVAGQRLRRTRDVLARAELERSRTTAGLEEARLQTLQGRIDPALLLRSMSALGERYRHGRESAEQLLDALVAFLRLAMPGVRGGASTLRDELALLRAHDELAALLDPGRARSVIDLATLPHALPFPPRLLLPLVERLRAAQPGAAPPPRVTLTAHAGSLKLVLDGCPRQDDWIGSELAQRLSTALRELHGQPGCWFAGGTPSLTLHLPPPTTPTLTTEEPFDETRPQSIA